MYKIKIIIFTAFIFYAYAHTSYYKPLVNKSAAHKTLLDLYRKHQTAPDAFDAYYQALGFPTRKQINESATQVFLRSAEQHNRFFNDLEQELAQRIMGLKCFYPTDSQAMLKENKQTLEAINRSLTDDLENLKIKTALCGTKKKLEDTEKKKLRSKFLKMVILPTPKGTESIDSFYLSIGMDRTLILEKVLNTMLKGTNIDNDLLKLEFALLNQMAEATDKYGQEIEELYYSEVTTESEYKKAQKRLRQLNHELTLDIKSIMDRASQLYSKKI